MVRTLESLGIDRMSVAERIVLVEKIWDSIAESPEQIPVTEAQVAELRRRLAAYREESGGCSTWEQVRARLRSVR